MKIERSQRPSGKANGYLAVLILLPFPDDETAKSVKNAFTYSLLQLHLHRMEAKAFENDPLQKVKSDLMRLSGVCATVHNAYYSNPCHSERKKSSLSSLSSIFCSSSHSVQAFCIMTVNPSFFFLN